MPEEVPEMSPLPRRLRDFLAAAVLCASPSAGAFLINIPPVVTVVEYKNVVIDHYFMTADPGEMAALESGAAGAGWIRTGFGFSAYAYPYPAGQAFGAVWVDRFHGTPGIGPNSHFFTADQAESASLKGPATGWTYEGTAFAIHAANGSCSSGMTPVYRLYNNRWMFNDSNHRYVTRASERAAMVAAGWIDEGVRFCSANAVELPFRTFAIDMPLAGNIHPSAECEDEALHLGPCLAINNLPVPQTLRENSPADLYALLPYTGVASNYAFAPRPTATVAELVRDVFVQGGGYYIGLHVDTRSRGASIFSSVNPLYQFRTDAGDGGVDPRFFPWATGLPFETQLSISESLGLARLNLRSPGSHAYGHPPLEFIDRRSGLHLYFTVLAYSTTAPSEADYLARDVATAKVIVGTAHRPGAGAYGRSVGASTAFTHSGYAAGSGTPLGGTFDFRIDRAEFQRVVDAARQLEPALSPDPADYLVDNFHFNNEVYGDGEIGLNLAHVTLRLLRR
jgi:Repeat of unknown function (DUF5648)